MRLHLVSVFGSATFAAAVVFTAVPASSSPLSAAAAASYTAADPLIEKIVVRRRAPVRAAVGVRRGRGFNPGAAAVIGLGVAGVAAAIIASERNERARERRQQYYYGQQPYGYAQQPAYYPQQACGWQQQPIYDQFGNYRGSRPVQVCQ